MFVKEFGGLPWNLLFREKPDFASGDTVLNCRLEEREGLPYIKKGQQKYSPDYVLCIDDVEIRNPYVFASSERRFFFQDGKLNIYDNTITDYLQRKDTILLLYWFMELNKELNKGGAYYSEYEAYIPNPTRDSIATLLDFLNRDYTTSNEEQHRTIAENYKALLLELIPTKETEKYGDFFQFFSKQDVVKKIDDSHYVLKHYLTPQRFKYLSSEALSNSYISYELKYKELQPLIYMDEKEKQLYSLDTWRKGKEKITEDMGIWKPRFLKEIFSKQGG